MTEMKYRTRMIEATAKETESLLKQKTNAELMHLKEPLDKLSKLGVDLTENVGDSNPDDLPDSADLKFVENQMLLHAVNTEEIGLFEVTFKKTKAHHSITEGKGIKEAIVGVEAQFVLSTRNAQGSVCHGNHDSIKLEITNDQGQNYATEVGIQDNKDGTYNISYSVLEVGKYSAVVKLNGEHVLGSPFALDVKSQELKAVPPLGRPGLQLKNRSIYIVATKNSNLKV